MSQRCRPQSTPPSNLLRPSSHRPTPPPTPSGPTHTHTHADANTHAQLEARRAERKHLDRANEFYFLTDGPAGQPLLICHSPSTLPRRLPHAITITYNPPIGRETYRERRRGGMRLRNDRKTLLISAPPPSPNTPGPLNYLPPGGFPGASANSTRRNGKTLDVSLWRPRPRQPCLV